MGMDRALDRDLDYTGIGSGALAAIRFAKNHDIELKDFNIPVRDVPVTVRNSGCIAGESSVTHETRPVASGCPADESERCSPCILTFGQGKELLEALAHYVPRGRGQPF